MKAKVKATGKIIDVKVHDMKADGTPISFCTLDRMGYYKVKELELESEKYETQDEWNNIYKVINALCDKAVAQTVKNDAHYNTLWSDVYTHLDAARGLLSKDKYDNKW